MSRIGKNLLRSLPPVMLLVAIVDSEAHAAEPGASLNEGWNAWRVAASETEGTRCCFSWSIGKPTMKSCDLDRRRGVSITNDSPELTGEMQIYALVEMGTPTKVVALSPQCPVSAATPINDLGLVPAADSISWLKAQIRGDDELSEDALSAIAAHEGAVGVLIETVEDRRRGKDLREEALFWLVQSDSDRAYDYLTSLLTGS